MAYQFNGTNQRLISTITLSPNVPLTIACRFYPNTTGAAISRILTVEPLNTSLVNQFSIYYLNSTINGYAVTNEGGVVTGTSTSAASVTNGAWNHAAAVFSSNSSRLVYLNGAAGTASSATVNIGAVDQFNLSATNTDGSSVAQFFNGRIAEAALWKAALTASEIAALASGFTPDQIRPQSLHFYAPLISSIQDARNASSITNVNGATVANHPRVYT